MGGGDGNKRWGRGLATLAMSWVQRHSSIMSKYFFPTLGHSLDSMPLERGMVLLSMPSRKRENNARVSAVWSSRME